MLSIFRSCRILTEYYALLSDHVTDLCVLSHNDALRLLKIIEPYLVEQERMANAQLLMYGSKHLEQNFFFFLRKKVFYYYLGLLSTMGYSVVSMKNQYKF